MSIERSLFEQHKELFANRPGLEGWGQDILA